MSPNIERNDCEQREGQDRLRKGTRTHIERERALIRFGFRRTGQYLAAVGANSYTARANILQHPLQDFVCLLLFLYWVVVVGITYLLTLQRWLLAITKVI